MLGKLMLAFAISFAATAIIGGALVPWLRKQKAGQSIREDGPTWHMSKAGTPTMGGIMFIAGSGIACFIIGFENMMSGDFAHLFIYFFSLIFGAIGFVDDYEKLRKKQNLGLTASKKFLLQLAVAVAFIYLLRYFGYIRPNLYIPFINRSIIMYEPLYFALAAFIIVGTVNSVNLTDGVDGLAAGTSLPVAGFYAAISFYWGQQFLTIGIYAAALLGGLVGFLIYNFNPAKVFMGDTGSLFLGGAVCATAFTLDMPLILLPLGIMYVIETISDIIQVLYFKATKGKRFFKMAPFHHHLEMGGWSGKKWSEKGLFLLFTGISLAAAIICFLAVRGRYGY